MQPRIFHKNNQVHIDQSALVETALEVTELTADMAIGTTLTVKNNNKFAINQVLLLGELGDEDTEFVKTHATAAVSGTTITLAATSIRSHGAGTKVYILSYDTIELTHATTATGTKSVLTTSVGNGLVSLEADEEVLTYNEPEYNSGYYFGRYTNSIGAAFTISGDTLTSSAHGLVTGQTVKLIAATTMPTGLTTYTLYYVVSAATNTFKVSLTNGGTAITASDSGSGTLTWYRSSLFSDAIQYAKVDQNTAEYVIQYALKRNGMTALSDLISQEFCFDEINACLQYIQNKQLRFDDFQALGAVIGQTSAGTFIFALPSDIYDNESNKSLTAVRVGHGTRLVYQDNREFDDRNRDMLYTQVTTQATSGQTTLAIDNSYDFDDSGTVVVYVSGTKYSITYTGVTRSATAGVLTGVPASGTGSISVTIPADTYVYQDIVEGKPAYYTVRGGNLEISPVVTGSYNNLNIYGDYWKVVTRVDSLGDTIDNIRYELVKNWLEFKMRMQKENNGKLDFTDGAWLLFREQLNDNIRNKGRGKKYATEPRVNRIRYK